MAKALKTVAIIAGAAALIIGTAGILAAPATAAALGAIGITASAAAVAAAASAVSVAASIGSQALAKPPPASGQINRLTVIKEAPSPYLIGRTYFGGILRHDAGYGATLNKVPNPYRGLVVEYGVGGPYDSLEGMYADFAALSFSGNAATGYYAGYMYRDTQVGSLTETALTPQFSGFPNWGASHILSGKAAILWNLKFDKDGKRFASGLPQLGAVWKGAKVYDPRLDSTYPGGSGAHRIDNEATWTWSENPALHALAYAYGRYKNGTLIFGIGLPATGIEIAHLVTLANVCDANGWTCGGVLFEPGDGWNNLKDILAAGAAEPLFIGGKLGVKINAPHVSLDTITDADLADDDAEVGASQTWRDRLNGIFPKYRSEAHRWDYVTAELVTVPAYVTEDGEEKNEQRQYNLVQDAAQAAQLAAYDLVNGRELGPITLVCKPRMRAYGPGDMLTLDLPYHGLDHDAIIVDRSIDPGTGKVILTMVTETTAKHAFALGLTGDPPPTPSLVSGEDRDTISHALLGGGVVGQNTLFNGSFKLGMNGWNSAGMQVYQDYRGSIVQQPVGTGGLFLANSLRPVTVAPGEPVTLQATFSGAATTLGFLFVDIEWRNTDNDAVIEYSSNPPRTNGVLFHNESGTRVLKSQIITAPAPTDGSTTVKAIVRVVGESDVAYVEGTRWVEQIKLEPGATVSSFSDEATDRAADIVDQGTGATADTLAQMDPAATAVLIQTTSGRAPEAVAIDSSTPIPISVTIGAGETIYVFAQAAGTPDAGSLLYLLVNARPSGGSDVSIISESVQGTYEYQTLSHSTAFTNTSGSSLTFEFRGEAGVFFSGTFDSLSSFMTV